MHLAGCNVCWRWQWVMWKSARRPLSKMDEISGSQGKQAHLRSRSLMISWLLSNFCQLERSGVARKVVLRRTRGDKTLMDD